MVARLEKQELHVVTVYSSKSILKFLLYHILVHELFCFSEATSRELLETAMPPLYKTLYIAHCLENFCFSAGLAWLLIPFRSFAVMLTWSSLFSSRSQSVSRYNVAESQRRPNSAVELVADGRFQTLFGSDQRQVLQDSSR
jgi:hypothetical protein